MRSERNTKWQNTCKTIDHGWRWYINNSVLCSCVRYKSATVNQLSCMPHIDAVWLEKKHRTGTKVAEPKSSKQWSKWSIRETSYTISMYLFHLEELQCNARKAGVHCAILWANTYVIPIIYIMWYRLCCILHNELKLDNRLMWHCGELCVCACILDTSCRK